MEDKEKAQRAAEQEMQAELERRWREAEAAEQAGLHGWELEYLYQEAAEYAREQAERMSTPLTGALVQQAEARRYQAGRLMALRGFQARGLFSRLLHELRLFDPERRIVISHDHTRAQETMEYVSVAEAIRIVEYQAREYAAEKACSYRERALGLLEKHAPEAAEREMRKALELFGLDEEECQRCRHLQAVAIQPAIERRTQAGGLLLEAQKRGDVRDAWRLLAEAEKLDPYTPGVDQLRNELVQRTVTYAETLLAQIGDLLQKVGQLAAYDVALQKLAAKVEAAQTILSVPDSPPE